jgi:hypothetical protein
LVISHFHILVGVASIIFVLLAEFRNLRLFTADSTDGFFSQVQYIGFLWSQNRLDYSKEPILAVHTIRFFIVYPWVISWLQNWPSLIEAVMFLPLLLTVALAKIKDRHHLIQLTIFLLPFGLSYRTVLTIIGIANLYLFLFSGRREPWRFALSFFASFLSSGVALAWFIIVALNFADLERFKRWAIIFGLPTAAGLFAVIQHKLGYFGDQSIDYANNTGVLGAIERNTIFVSYQVGDTARFILYTSILAAVVLFILLLSNLPKSGRPLLYFFLSAASAFLFEGLGAIAFFMPVLWALQGAAVLKSTPEPSPE